MKGLVTRKKCFSNEKGAIESFCLTARIWPKAKIGQDNVRYMPKKYNFDNFSLFTSSLRPALS